MRPDKTYWQVEEHCYVGSYYKATDLAGWLDRQVRQVHSFVG
jgi:hypothetical protein